MKNDMDAQFLCKDCERYNLCRYYDRRKEYSYICKYFHLPSVENKGEWIYQEGVTPYKWRCNKCERMFKTDFNYCPNCGADMRGEVNE